MNPTARDRALEQLRADYPFDSDADIRNTLDNTAYGALVMLRHQFIAIIEAVTGKDVGA